MKLVRLFQLFAVCVCAVVALAVGSPTAEASIVPQLYWVTQATGGSGNGAIWRKNLDGSGGVEIVQNFGGGTWAKDVAVDPAGGKLYWTGSGGVRRSNLDGTGVETVVGGLVGGNGVTLDVAGGKVYWFEENTIRRANLSDGSSVEDLITTSITLPGKLDLDRAAGKIYWTNRNTNGLSSVQRSNLDGSNMQGVVGSGGLLTKYRGIAVDAVAGQFWIDNAISNSNKVRRRTPSGTVTDIFVGNGLGEGIALDAQGGHVYWDRSGVIERADFDGSNRTGFVGGATVTGLQGMAVLLPEPGTLLLLACGGLMLAGRRHRRV